MRFAWFEGKDSVFEIPSFSVCACVSCESVNLQFGMWRDPGVSGDSFYQVRPECTDVPKSRFKIKVRVFAYLCIVLIAIYFDLESHNPS